MTHLIFSIPMITHLLIGFYFVFFGFWNIYHWRPIIEIMLQEKIPHPLFLLPIGIAWQSIFGFMIIFGIYTGLAALLLLPFTIIAACMFHPFWRRQGESRTLNLIIFITHMTVTVSVLLFLIYTHMPINQITTIPV